MRRVVTTCDRCDKEVSNDARLVASSLGTAAASMHFCAACAHDLDGWVAKYRINNNLKPVSA